MNDKENLRGEVLLYRAEDGQPAMEVVLDRETVWLSLNQVAKLFGRDKSVISRHLKNVYETRELSRKATVAKNATVQKEAGRQVKRRVEYYNLDAILSVGYRVNSKRGTQFRIWATQTLKEHLTRGYTLNLQRFVQNAREWVPKTLIFAKGEAETGEHPVDVHPAERAGHGRSALGFRAERGARAKKHAHADCAIMTNLCAVPGKIDSLWPSFPTAINTALKLPRFEPIIRITTPATPLHGSAPGGLLFSGAGK